MRLAILGSGPGGYVAALKAAQLGAQVTVIEDSEVGGVCLNRGCIPTKAIVASCELLAKVGEMDKFGIELEGTVKPNLAKIMDRKNKVVGIQVKGVRSLFKSWGVSLREGRGVLTSPRQIEVTGRDGSREAVSADAVIIATGSRPAQIPAFPFDGKNIISSTEALELTEIPRSLLIIGAGVIGAEFACIFKTLGSDVTVVEALARAVATEDEEVSDLLQYEFKKKGIRLITNSRVEKIGVRDDGVHAVLSDGAELVAEKVMVCIGRTFNSDQIGLEAAGVGRGGRGEIAVNGRMETNVPGVYAIGDVTGVNLLAHVASAGGVVAAKNLMGIESAMQYDVVPSAIFTSPEIASVGLREQQARERGLKYRTGRFQLRGLGKAHVIGEPTGFVKIISDEGTDRILGAHIVGAHASELIHELALAMRTGRTSREVAETIHAHPTIAEVIAEAAEEVHGEAVHVMKR